MPELPEVETVRRTLAPALERRIERVWAARAELRGVPIARRRLARLTGHRIGGLRRWGKYLLIDIADVDDVGRDDVLVVHLGMTGRLRLHAPDDPRAPHTHVVFGLGDLELRYSDPRRFGHISLTRQSREREHPPLAVLGIDALSDELDAETLHRAARQTSRSLKTFLLDQSVVAGLGNIYVSEALWLARIRPTTRANRLSLPRARLLVRAIRQTLTRALELGGTSLRDFVAADGATGENVHYLRVYDRTGAACPRRGCDGTIRRRVVGGRATFHCPRCQTG